MFTLYHNNLKIESIYEIDKKPRNIKPNNKITIDVSGKSLTKAQNTT